jgi:hypothetical protein
VALLDRNPGPGELDFSKSLWDKNDFIASIQEKRQPLETIENGHRAASIAQIGLIACRLGEKLQWDPAREAFHENNYADSLLAVPVERQDWAS